MRRLPYKGSAVIHLSTPLYRASSMRRVRGQSTTDSFKRLLLCIFSRTGRNFTQICEVLTEEYTPQSIAARIGPHGHGSLLGDVSWYPVYWDYSDLLSDTWRQTARSLWFFMLSERGVTPTTADQIKFVVFVTSPQDAPPWREQMKLEKEESAIRRAVGLGPSSLERRKHTLASYLMGPNAVARQPTKGTWRPTSDPTPRRRCKAPGAHATCQCQRTTARECAQRTARASRLPMDSGLELVRHANTKRLEFDTGSHQVPLMQRSSYLGFGTGRVIWMSLAGGTSRRIRRMKMRTVTQVL